MQHWIFDLDGTLVDSIESYFEKLRRVFSHFDVPFTDADLQKACDYFDAREFFALYLDERHLDQACKLLTSLSLELAHLAKPFPEIEGLLDDLRSRGSQLSVWTGRDLQSARKILDHTGLGSYFSTVVSGTCVKRKKPDPEGLLKLLDQTRSDPKATIMVGDHLCDMQGARGANVKAISVSWLTDRKHPLEDVSDAHFWRVSDLRKWAESNA